MIFLKVTQALRIRHFKKEKKHYTYIQNTKNSGKTKYFIPVFRQKKYRIPWLKTPKIPYTQNPWPGLVHGDIKFWSTCIKIKINRSLFYSFNKSRARTDYDVIIWSHYNWVRNLSDDSGFKQFMTSQKNPATMKSEIRVPSWTQCLYYFRPFSFHLIP